MNWFVFASLTKSRYIEQSAVSLKQELFTAEDAEGRKGKSVELMMLMRTS